MFLRYVISNALQMKKTLIMLCAIIMSVTLRAQYDARTIQLENRIYEEGP